MNYITLTVRDEITDGDSIYVATHPELPGCMVQGDTAHAARMCLDEARTLYLALLADAGIIPPVPMRIDDTMILTIDVNDLTVRVEC